MALVILTMLLAALFASYLVGLWVAGPVAERTSRSRADAVIVSLVLFAVLAAASLLAPIALTGGLQR